MRGEDQRGQGAGHTRAGYVMLMYGNVTIRLINVHNDYALEICQTERNHWEGRDE